MSPTLSTSNLDKIKELAPVVKKYLDQFILDPCLVLAIMWQESKFDPIAVRFEEEKFEKKSFYLPQIIAPKLRISVATEQALQCFSFGTMQILGSTARGDGYTESLLHLAGNTQTGIFWGMNHLSKLVEKYGNTDSAIASYNSGSPRFQANGKFTNQDYVDNVKAIKIQIENLKLF